MDKFEFVVEQTLSVIAVVLAIGIVSITVLKPTLDHQMEMFRAEADCVSKLIPDGVERRDIATMNGECWVEKDGYNKYSTEFKLVFIGYNK